MKKYPAINPEANGNAWFIDKLVGVATADEELLSLKDFNEKTQAIVNINDFSINRTDFKVDSTSTIKMTNYIPNHLTYKSDNTNAGVVVFSEMYYANGWNAYIDGVKKDHFKANYVLRALRIPEGKHTVEFKFEPTIIQKGSNITLASTILFGLIFLGGLGVSFWRSKKEREVAK